MSSNIQKYIALTTGGDIRMTYSKSIYPDITEWEDVPIEYNEFKHEVHHDGAKFVYNMDVDSVAAKRLADAEEEKKARALANLISAVKASYNDQRDSSGVQVSITSPATINHKMTAFDRDAMVGLITLGTAAGRAATDVLTTDGFDFDDAPATPITIQLASALSAAYQIALNGLYQSKKRTVTALTAKTSPQASDLFIWGITSDHLTQAGISTT